MKVYIKLTDSDVPSDVLMHWTYVGECHSLELQQGGGLQEQFGLMSTPGGFSSPSLLCHFDPDSIQCVYEAVTHFRPYT